MASRGTLKKAVAQRLRAYELHNAGDHAGAIAALKALVEKCPWYSDGWCSLAKFLIEDRKFPSARTAAERAIALARHNPHAYTNAGIAARETGDLEAARAYLERAVELSPSDPIARFQLAKTLARAGDCHRAAATFIHALALAQFGGFDAARIVNECVDGLAALRPSEDFPEPISAFIAVAAAMRNGALAKTNDLLVHLTALTLSDEQRQATDRLRRTMWRRAS